MRIWFLPDIPFVPTDLSSRLVCFLENNLCRTLKLHKLCTFCVKIKYTWMLTDLLIMELFPF